MTQADLFAAPDERCGTCVHRNARTVEVERGYCTPHGGYRAASSRACDQWFGLEQLTAACAPRNGKSRAPG